jgi:hypothetical protein
VARLHQTTIRFGNDLWAALEVEAARLGVSAAHYIREAALARLAYAAGRRADPRQEDAAPTGGVGGASSHPWQAEEESLAADRAGLNRQADALDASQEAISESEALWAQSKLARQRARELRERSEHHRRPV